MNCTNRTAECHSNCFEYVLYKRNLELEKEKIKRYYWQNGELSVYINKRVIRATYEKSKGGKCTNE